MAERFLREDALRVEQDLPIDRANTVIFFLQREKTDRRIPAGPFPFQFFFLPRRREHRSFHALPFAAGLLSNRQLKVYRKVTIIFLK